MILKCKGLWQKSISSRNEIQIDFYDPPLLQLHSAKSSVQQKQVFGLGLKLNLHWHELWKQEKCSSLAPPRGTFIRLNELGRVSNKPNWCQFSPPKSLEIFDKKSTYKIWSNIDKEIKVSLLIPIRIKTCIFSNSLRGNHCLGE